VRHRLWLLACWCTARAEALGFVADAGIDEVVQAFIEGDLQMQKQLV
jgi:hypothetical protein